MEQGCARIDEYMNQEPLVEICHGSSRMLTPTMPRKGRFHEDNVFHVGGMPTIWLYWTESLSSESAGLRERIVEDFLGNVATEGFHH